MPLQAEKEHRGHQRANNGVEESALPISVVQNPVVLIGEDDQSGWYSLPAAISVPNNPMKCGYMRTASTRGMRRFHLFRVGDSPCCHG